MLRMTFGWVAVTLLTVTVGCGEVKDDTDAAGSHIDAARSEDAASIDAPVPECTGAGDCDDEQYCNGVEQCVDEHCEPGDAVNCNDDIACTDDACAEDIDDCTNVPNHALCTGPDAPYCDPATGCRDQPCSGPPDCDDGVFCNGVEVCDIPAGDSVGSCIAGELPRCDDTIDCTVDTCSAGSDSCVSSPDDLRCSDALFCNGAEICDDVLGCIDGPDPDPSDGIACTQDACVESSDTFSHTSVDSLCADGSFCNGDETCDPTLGCVDGPDPDPSDGVDCTIDTCVDASGGFAHTPDDTFCADASFCNGDEYCDTNIGCQPGAPVTCVDDACISGNTCSDVSKQCIGTAVSRTVSWDATDALTGGTVAGTAVLFCTEEAVVLIDPDFCPTVNFEYVCAITSAGEVIASSRPSMFDGFCTGMIGAAVSSGCSTVNMPGPKYRPFHCCI